MAQPDEWISELPALVRAAAQGNISETADLLQAGAAVDTRSHGGFTPLLNAARAEAPVAAALLNAGAEVDAQDFRPDRTHSCGRSWRHRMRRATPPRRSQPCRDLRRPDRFLAGR
jgi:hypothetical protein